MNVQEINLGEICSSPRNPRRHEDKKKLEELAASIKQKGVIEPILVRAAGKGAKVRFEIVAGERRWKAAAMAGLAKIPCLVRELTDDEAYDFMLIENLQREDLTDQEEAESFKAYASIHKGEDGILALAEKTGISPAYIRSRVRVLALPAKILKAWDEGKLSFGHMVQLLRVAKDEAALARALAWTLNSAYSPRQAETADALRHYVNEQAPPLKAALFKTEGVCDRCGSNSAVQKELFDISTDKIRCHNPSCFKQRQLKAIAEGWKTTPLGKSCGTNRAIINDDQRVAYHGFCSSPPTGKCRACPDFATFLALDGEVRDRQVCVGNEKCHSALGRQRGQEKRSDRNPEAPRAKWHGEFFRDVFLSKRIPEVLATIDPEDPKIKVLLLACAVHGNRATLDMRNNSAGLLAKTPAELKKAYKAVVEKVVLAGQHVGPDEYNGFGTKGRRLVAEFLGIDLAKEYAVDKDYLDKKTKAEILAFGKKFKLPRMAGAAVLKKADLVRLVLENGKGLVGKVPAEILK